MTLQRMKRWNFWLCLMLLTACVNPPAKNSPDIDEWSGRLVIQVLNDPPQSLSAGFELQGSAETGQMVLLSPVGTSLARLQWQPGFARLEQGQQQVQSTSLEYLASILTGTELPISALFEWLAGRPADSPGWHIDLSSHAQGRITAERIRPAPITRLRIVLDR
jgi:outer membrane lipoprotein LolB